MRSDSPSSKSVCDSTTACITDLTKTSKTFGIPSISKVLLATGELASHLSSSKRAADTAALLFEPLANAPESDRAAAAIARTNALHAPHRAAGRIRNDDMLYTLAVLAIEPVRWVRQHEWRSLTELELAAIGTFWRAVGDAMSVDYAPLTNYVEPGLAEKAPSAVDVRFRDGAQWLAAIERFTDVYEATDMRPAPSNTALTQARLRVLLQPGSQLTRPLRAHAFASLMPPRLRTALGLPTPPTWMQKLLSWILTFRKILLRHCFLPRPRFLAVHVVSKDMDKAGRCALELYMTHPWYVKPSLSWRWGLDAWIGRLRGEILPGDEGDKYRPEGYLVHELGPDRLKGKRVAEFERQKAFVRGEGGFNGARCPFMES